MTKKNPNLPINGKNNTGKYLNWLFLTLLERKNQITILTRVLSELPLENCYLFELFNGYCKWNNQGCKKSSE